MTDGPTGQRTERPGETTASRLPHRPDVAPGQPAPAAAGLEPRAAQPPSRPTPLPSAPCRRRRAPAEPSGPSFGERLGARWNRARDEHRASAAAKLEQPARQPAAARRRPAGPGCG